MKGINNNQVNLNTSSLQADQQRQTSSIEQNRTNPQSAAVATNTQSPPPPVAAAAPLAPPTAWAAAVAQDAALRRQLIPEGATPPRATSAAGEAAAAAVGVEESKGDAKAQRGIFDILTQDVVVGGVLSLLDPDSLENFAQTSETSMTYAIESAKYQISFLNEKLNELITDPKIKGVKIPEGPFKTSIEQLRELTAFKDNLPNAIRVLKEKGITDINATYEYGRTPLHRAAIRGRTEIETVRALINAGADVNLVDDFGNTPLHLAAQDGPTETLEALLNAGADVNLVDDFGNTPLHVAAFNGHPETVRALRAAGAEVNLANIDGNTPLHEAVMNGQTEIVKILRTAQNTHQAQRYIFDRLPQDVFNHMCLFLDIRHIAALSQTSKKLNSYAIECEKEKIPRLKEELYKLIEECNRDPNKIKGVKIPEGPFHNSIHELSFLTDSKENLPNAIYVLQRNRITDITKKSTRDDNTPLHDAALKGRLDRVQALVAAGAEVNAQNREGNTPLHRAAQFGPTETLEALLNAGADVNLADNGGYTPLMSATYKSLARKKNRLDIVQALLARGADVNLADKYGYAPLHTAAFKGYKEVVSLLVEAGADVNAWSRFGTPLHEARRNGHTVIVSLLKNAQNTQSAAAAAGGVQESKGDWLDSPFTWD